MGPRAGMDGCGKSRPPPTGVRSPDRPARSESLYRLNYRGRISTVCFSPKNHIFLKPKLLSISCHVHYTHAMSAYRKLTKTHLFKLRFFFKLFTFKALRFGWK